MSFFLGFASSFFTGIFCSSGCNIDMYILYITITRTVVFDVVFIRNKVKNLAADLENETTTN